MNLADKTITTEGSITGITLLPEVPEYPLDLGSEENI